MRTLWALLGAAGGFEAKGDFAVAAYLPEWRYEGANWDVICEHVSHLILFSCEMDPSGKITALDRLPRVELFDEARTAAAKHGTKLLLCFGGNGRSNGFSGMVSSAKSRKRFLKALVKLLDKHGLDGVDYNWEYPGYDFRRGYLPEAEVRRKLLLENCSFLPHLFHASTRMRFVTSDFGMLESSEYLFSMFFPRQSLNILEPC